MANTELPPGEALALLRWLVESGADEAIGEEPVNRFVARTNPIPSPLAGEGKSNAKRSTWEGEIARTPPPPSRSAARPLPRGEAEQIRETSGDDIGDAMAIAAAAATLAELKTALENFDGCALKKFAANTVFADGVEGAPILCIGEAPGHEEDRAGLPFVGRAGRLLDKMLAPIGLDRKRNVYIVNVLPWRPPDNRNPDPVEVAKCIPFLRRHIELADPKIIVLLGAVAARHVMGLNDGIMKSRGRWMEYRIGTRMVPILPTLHPAYLLRQPAHKKLAWRDLQALEARMTELKLDVAARADTG